MLQRQSSELDLHGEVAAEVAQALTRMSTNPRLGRASQMSGASPKNRDNNKSGFDMITESKTGQDDDDDLGADDEEFQRIVGRLQRAVTGLQTSKKSRKASTKLQPPSDARPLAGSSPIWPAAEISRSPDASSSTTP